MVCSGLLLECGWWMAKNILRSPRPKSRARVGPGIAVVSTLVVAAFVLHGLARQQDESISSPGRSELSGTGGRDPEVSVATQEFDRSLREETAAKKELERRRRLLRGGCQTFHPRCSEAQLGPSKGRLSPTASGICLGRVDGTTQRHHT